MEVYEPNTQRFAVALELLKEGSSLTFDGVSFWLSSDGYLNVNVDSSWWIGNTTERTALNDLERAKNVLAYLVRESPAFAEMIKERPQRFMLSYFDGRDGVLLGHYGDGEIVWVGGQSPSQGAV